MKYIPILLLLAVAACGPEAWENSMKEVCRLAPNCKCNTADCEFPTSK